MPDCDTPWFRFSVKMTNPVARVRSLSSALSSGDVTKILDSLLNLQNSISPNSIQMFIESEFCVPSLVESFQQIIEIQDEHLIESAVTCLAPLSIEFQSFP